MLQSMLASLTAELNEGDNWIQTAEKRLGQEQPLSEEPGALQQQETDLQVSL